MIEKLLEDERPIKAVYYNDGEGGCHVVGQFDCTKIEAYNEEGLRSMMPYIAVWHEDKIKHRIPAYMVQISY